jgi:hypothetical protein
MTNYQTDKGQTAMNTQINWRTDYESFRGMTWTFGLYRINEDKHGFELFHGDKLIRRFRHWIDADSYARGMMTKLGKH